MLLILAMFLGYDLPKEVTIDFKMGSNEVVDVYNEGFLQETQYKDYLQASELQANASNSRPIPFRYLKYISN